MKDQNNINHLIDPFQFRDSFLYPLKICKVLLYFVFLFSIMFQDSPFGTYITTFSAKDPDKGLNQLVSYHIIAGNELGDLYLNESTGVLTTNALLDYERVQSYNVRLVSASQKNKQTSPSFHLGCIFKNFA